MQPDNRPHPELMPRIINNILYYFAPSDNWKFTAMFITAIISGLIIFIIYISGAPSYISDNPKTCINCHVMFPQYATWQHSSHYHTATCNDCHVPHDNFVNKYFFKAGDGMRHAAIFTMRNEPQVIQIREAGINVVQQNCIRCHRDLVEMVSAVEVTGENSGEGKRKRCSDCHRETPHGTVNSLSSAPYALVPHLMPVFNNNSRDSMELNFKP